MGYCRYRASYAAWSIIMSQHKIPAFPTNSPKCIIGLCTFGGFPWKILQHASLREKISPEGYSGSWHFSSAPAGLKIDFMMAKLGIKIRTLIIRYSVKLFGWMDLYSWHIQEAEKKKWQNCRSLSKTARDKPCPMQALHRSGKGLRHHLISRSQKT